MASPKHHAPSSSRVFWRRLGMVTTGVVLGVCLALALQAARDGLGANPLSLELGHGLGVGLVLTLALVLAL